MENTANNLNYNNLIIVDIETTGVNIEQDEIIQIAAYAIGSGDTFECKCIFEEKDGMQEALRINHYDHDVWKKQAIELKTALRLFNYFCKRNASINKISKAGNEYKIAVVGGYNSNFDISFLTRKMQEEKIFCYFDLRFFDVMQLALWKLPNLKSYKLIDVAKHLNLNLDINCHEASIDCLLTTEVLKKLLRIETTYPKWLNLGE